MLGDIIQAPDPETLQASLRLSSGSCTAPMAVSALGMCIVRDVLPGASLASCCALLGIGKMPCCWLSPSAV